MDEQNESFTEMKNLSFLKTNDVFRIFTERTSFPKHFEYTIEQFTNTLVEKQTKKFRTNDLFEKTFEQRIVVLLSREIIRKKLLQPRQ